MSEFKPLPETIESWINSKSDAREATFKDMEDTDSIEELFRGMPQELSLLALKKIVEMKLTGESRFGNLTAIAAALASAAEMCSRFDDPSAEMAFWFTIVIEMLPDEFVGALRDLSASGLNDPRPPTR